nr:hypothetical protein [Tanacetum cinerariifolium]
MYSIDLNNVVPHKDLTCLVAKASADESMLWHRRLGKQHKASCKTKLVNSMTKPLHTLYMDLFGPTSDKTSDIFRNFITEIENLKELKVKIIRCDNGGEFRNKEINDFCSMKGIKREFSNAKTPHQNGVAERRNRTLIKAVRTMMADAKLPVTFWAKAVYTACYVQNRVLVNKSKNKTPYKLFNGRTSPIGFLKPFGCHVMILNTLDNLGKFKAKGDEYYFIRYSMSRKAFRVFNKRTKRVEENLHVDFLENKPIKKGAGPNWLFDINSLTNSMNYVPVVVAGINSTNFLGTKEAASQDVKKDVSSLRYIALPNWFHEEHLESSTSNAQDAPESSGNSNPTATSTNPLADHMETLAVETPIPTVSSHVLTACLNNSSEPSSDTRLISKRVTSQDDTSSLDNILTLTNRFEDILGVTTNTDDTNGVEADLGNMEDNISASHTPTLRIHKDHPKRFTIYLMDVKSAFLYGTIDEEVYVMHPPRFQVPEFPARVYKVEKEMYGLHQAPRAWRYPQEIWIFRCQIIKYSHGKGESLGKDETRKDVDLHLYRSMIESLMYLTASRPDIMFAVCAYARHQVTPKECHLYVVKRIFRYLKGHPKLGLWYPKESPFDLVAYSDSNYGGATQDRKSTTEGCQFLGKRLISWQCKKQTIVATSTTEAEYVAAASGLETPIPTVSSPVPTACLNDYLEPSNILGVTINTDDTNGVEANLGNTEDNISASPTPTLRIHKDHSKSQIIGPVDTPVQTRTKSKAMEEQSFIATIHQKTNPALLQFCLFLWVRPIGKIWLLKNKKDERGIDPEFLTTVYKVEKAMYGLHQAPRADDNIFGSSNPQLCREFEALMHEKFQMSAMGELNFFLGLQVLQKKDGIFLSQDKYVGDIHKKFRYSDVRSSSTLMDKENPWGKDETGKDVNLHLYRSMIGSLMYLTASRPDIMF